MWLPVIYEDLKGLYVECWALHMNERERERELPLKHDAINCMKGISMVDNGDELHVNFA